jgi:hypothetical protein
MGMKGRAVPLAAIGAASDSDMPPVLPPALLAELRGLAASGLSAGTSVTWARPALSVAPMMAWTTPHYRALARLLSRRVLLFTEMLPARCRTD